MFWWKFWISLILPYTCFIFSNSSRDWKGRQLQSMFSFWVIRRSWKIRNSNYQNLIQAILHPPLLFAVFPCFLVHKLSNLWIQNKCTVKPVYSDHPLDRKKVVVVQRWSLFRGLNKKYLIKKSHFYFKRMHFELITAILINFNQF